MREHSYHGITRIGKTLSQVTDEEILDQLPKKHSLTVHRTSQDHFYFLGDFSFCHELPGTVPYCEIKGRINEALRLHFENNVNRSRYLTRG